VGAREDSPSASVYRLLSVSREEVTMKRVLALLTVVLVGTIFCARTFAAPDSLALREAVRKEVERHAVNNMTPISPEQLSGAGVQQVYARAAVRASLNELGGRVSVYRFTSGEATAFVIYLEEGYFKQNTAHQTLWAFDDSNTEILQGTQLQDGPW